MDAKKRNLIIGAVAAVIVIILVLVLRGGGNSDSESAQIPTEGVIPTVDGSVIVDLKPAAKKGEVNLTVKNAPNGTRGIEYTISYDALSQEEGAEGPVPQGAIGKCTDDEGTWQCGEPAPGGGDRKIVLGTCSSGTCRYHNVSGPVKVSLKFTGSYGERIFEKDYDL